MLGIFRKFDSNRFIIIFTFKRSTSGIILEYLYQFPYDFATLVAAHFVKINLLSADCGQVFRIGKREKIPVRLFFIETDKKSSMALRRSEVPLQ